MDKCTALAVLGTEPGSVEERYKYGANRIAEALFYVCITVFNKALLAGDAEKSPIFVSEL